MTITERTLKKWRREALKSREILFPALDESERGSLEEAERILRMTQELLDQHLLRKEVR